MKKLKWRLLATVVEHDRRVVHVHMNTAGDKLRCSCGENTPQAVAYDPDATEPPLYRYRGVDGPLVCRHIRMLYFANPAMAKVNFTELGREIFHAKYAARAMEK